MSWGPISIPAATSSAMGQDVDVPMTGIAMPCHDCYITAMQPNLTYTDGSTASIATGAWFHHVVFFDSGSGKSDPGCPAIGAGLGGERFYASGDEKSNFGLPPGYGFYVGASDSWSLLYMLMNMNPTAINVDIQLKINWVPASAKLTPVKPVWLSLNNCGSEETNLSGTGYQELTYTWTNTVPGQLLTIGGHVHDGGINIYADDDTQNHLLLCNSVSSYSPTPSMAGMTGMGSMPIGQDVITGINGCVGGYNGKPPLATLNSGDQISIHGIYDVGAADPGADTTGVMAIMLAYIVPQGAVPGGTNS